MRRIFVAVALLVALSMSARTSQAAIAFDSASRAASTATGTTSISWSHTIGGGTDRFLLVGVAAEDASTTDASITSVTYNGVALTAVPGSKISGGGTGIIQTQLFYGFGTSLGAAGAHTVAVTFQGPVDGVSASSVSFSGVSQAAPEAATTRTDTSGADSISTTITTRSANAWVVDVVGSGNSGSFTPGSGQTERTDIAASGMTGATSSKPVAAAGATTMSWTHSGANRLAHSLVSLAASGGGGTVGPFALTTSVSGSGTIARNPDAATYPAGTVVTLTATPAAGFTFAGWSGDLSGSANPNQIVMNADHSVTANFTQPGGGGGNFGLFGFATLNGGTTGGAGGPTVTATTLDQLRSFCAQSGPLIIRVVGTITGDESIRVSSNKSILGAPGAHLIGLGFTIGQNSQFGLIGNVIIRNLIMEKPLAPIDKVTIQNGAHNVWIDHNEFFSDLDHGIDFYDGQVDVTHGADFITVSWNIFHDHFKNSLVGNSENTGDEDTGHLRITYHHNFFHQVDGRNPSIRFGTGHVYNNYYLDIGDYGIASRQNAQVRVERNFFDGVPIPIRADTSLSDVPGFVNQVDTNRFVNCGPSSITTAPGNFVPPYNFVLDAVDDVPGIVMQGAGAGKVTF
jgi:pectate lyase